MNTTSIDTERDAFAQLPFLALIRRELITQLRTRRIFFSLLALSIVCSWMILSQWPYGGSFHWQALARETQRLFVSFSILAMTGGSIVVAAIAGAALVGERERESWDLLQLSLISRLGIVAGKILSPFAVFALTLFVCAPIFSALLFLAGLDFVRAGQCLLLIAVTALTSGSIALACSVRARRTITAITITFFFVAMFMGLDAVAIAAALEFVDDVLEIPVSGIEFEQVFLLSPYFILGSILESGLPVWGLLIAHLCFQFIVLSSTITWCVWALGRGDVPVSDSEPRRWFRRHASVHTAIARRRRSIPDRSNPIFRREIYWGSPFSGSRARRFLITVFIAAFLISAALAYTGTSSGSRDGRLIVALISTVLAGAVACLYVPIVCAGAYTKELAISNFDMLRGTLMRPGQIVWGKFRAALALCFAVMLFCFAANLPVNFLFLSNPDGWYILMLTYGSLFAALAEAAAVGLFASFYSRRSGAAILVSYLMVFMLFFGFFIVIAIFAQGLDVSENDLSFRLLVAASPVLTYFWGLIETIDQNNYEKLGDWLASLGIVAVVAVSLQLWMIGRFDARIEKLSGD